jgi:hypothetical protein
MRITTFAPSRTILGLPNFSKKLRTMDSSHSAQYLISRPIIYPKFFIIIYGKWKFVFYLLLNSRSTLWRPWELANYGLNRNTVRDADIFLRKNLSVLPQRLSLKSENRWLLSLPQNASVRGSFVASETLSAIFDTHLAASQCETGRIRMRDLWIEETAKDVESVTTCLQAAIENSDLFLLHFQTPSRKASWIFFLSDFAPNDFSIVTQTMDIDIEPNIASLALSKAIKN